MIARFKEGKKSAYLIEIYTDGSHRYSVTSSSFYLKNSFTGRDVYHAESWHHRKHGYLESAREGEIHAAIIGINFILERFTNESIYYGVDFSPIYNFLCANRREEFNDVDSGLMQKLERLKMAMTESNIKFYVDDIKAHTGKYGNVLADKLCKLVREKKNGYYHVDLMGETRNIDFDKCKNLKLPVRW